jgi:putative SOS response-associated peptidase YedK
MCAQFIIKANVQKMARKYGMLIPEESGEFTERILPYRLAPVVVANQSDWEIKEMHFSLVPAWSKEPRVKFPTHNARIETIDTKPTWKKPFESQRCLVPMTDFIEPIYEGEHAGFMVGFHNKSGDVMFAAGIWDQWVNKETGEVFDSFAIITGDPIPFVAEMKHDRTPIYLAQKAWKSWLEPVKKNPVELKKLICSNVEPVELEVFHDRAMKPGWQKRK